MMTRQNGSLRCFGCGSRSDRDKGIGFYRIPSVVTNKGESEEKLTTERREKWIKPISSGETESKDVLNSERVCGKDFVSGKAAPYWHRHDVDRVPTLQLGKKIFRPKLDHDANAKRAERAKKRKQLAVERQEREAAEKRQKLVESSLPVAQIDFSQPSTSTKEKKENRNEGNEEAFSSHLAAIAVCEGKEIELETVTSKADAECQTSEFDYDLAYRFVVSVSTVSRIFFHWIAAMETSLFRFVYWPDRDQLWRTMPQCFQYAFRKKTTVVIDSFEVFIERPSKFLAQTFSSYKYHNTIKILIGITPQGTISFVSQA
ncbi:hypothetical protein AWC38_SpisGene23248 [Stylophora pistillata]|uniref:DDE Tnp4 domain-containing protein n=1 Tax=Stylophora pistillata TaxID=50429 RepID=A0A2B4R7E8_STYPI|nr:hypothetical protein AWC38_SpisGene23248 [Stylophora pistillata]